LSGQLDGQVALVTGAASGIGRAIVERFVADGAQVVMLDLGADGMDEIEQRLGGAVIGVVGDVRDPAAHAGAVRAAIDRFGQIDVLVANAGVFDGSVRLQAMNEATLVTAFDELFSVNVLGYLLAARAAANELRRRRGAIVLTVSNAGFHAGSGGGVLYTASKHAVVGLIRQLAFELAPHVRVNGVAPGGTVTDLRVIDPLIEAVGRRRQFADRAASERAISDSNPLGIVARPEDHAGAFAFLASGQCPAVTGEILSSDGGLAVRGLEFDRAVTEESTR
jgi:NAD(P)-dependent dehydrogenase (short-subunit alcohol dehydrogenase family)